MQTRHNWLEEKFLSYEIVDKQNLSGMRIKQAEFASRHSQQNFNATGPIEIN